VGMRALPAIFGSLTVPVVYGIMKESGYGNVISAFSASIVLFGAYSIYLLRFSSRLEYFFFPRRQRTHCAVAPHTIGRRTYLFPICHHVFLH
jgi:hypothetical protein